jgi:hypothetical protein
MPIRSTSSSRRSTRARDDELADLVHQRVEPSQVHANRLP